MYQNGYGGYPMQGGYQTMANPWQQRLNQMEQQSAPRYDIIRVNGEAGAKSLRMGPNSSTLVMDETGPIVWLCQTDGAGYMTATPYEIKPYQAEQHADLKSIEQRLSRLEAMMHDQSHDGADAQKRE